MISTVVIILKRSFTYDVNTAQQRTNTSVDGSIHLDLILCELVRNCEGKWQQLLPDQISLNILLVLHRLPSFLTAPFLSGVWVGGRRWRRTFDRFLVTTNIPNGVKMPYKKHKPHSHNGFEWIEIVGYRQNGHLPANSRKSFRFFFLLFPHLHLRSHIKSQILRFEHMRRPLENRLWNWYWDRSEWIKRNESGWIRKTNKN